MILILAENGDVSVSGIVSWLIFLKKEFVRINETDHVDIIQGEGLDGLVLEVNKTLRVNLKEVTNYFYRRGYWQTDGTPLQTSVPEFDKDLNRYLFGEKRAVYEFLSYYLENNYPDSIGNKEFSEKAIKLQVLDKARRNGVKTPKMFFTKSKEELKRWMQKENISSVITKPISNTLKTNIAGWEYPLFTEELTEQAFSKLPPDFSLSLFQEKIEKKYEIRSFYLKGSFYSMAIFSQNDPKTSVDFRKYNLEKPNRMVPFQLPAAEEEKLHKMMLDIGINTGSIDLLVDRDNNYLFLEVNPAGQFGMTSYPCNYFIEKKIAEKL